VAEATSVVVVLSGREALATGLVRETVGADDTDTVTLTGTDVTTTPFESTTRAVRTTAPDEVAVQLTV
jgi:hypothetical protein